MGDAVMKCLHTFGLACLLAGACAPAPEVMVEEEAPALVVTNWTDRTELFVEFPPLVVGEEATFAVHFTDLSDFSALTSGVARVEMTPEGGGAPMIWEAAPSRPGVFGPRVVPTTPGRYALVISVEAPGVTDRHDIGTATVYPDQARAWAAAEAQASEDAAAISYLKEQQWVNPFAAAPAAEADLQRAVRVPAEIGPVTGGEAIVSAPADGRFTADALLSIGTMVREGDAIGRLEPRLAEGGLDRATLVAAVTEADLDVDAARVELERAEGLLAERAVPARRVDEARRALAVAEARVAAAGARLAQRDEVLQAGGGTAAGNSFALRAPIGGRLAEVYAALGAAYDEGAPLFRIVRTDEVELRAMVPAADVPAVRDVTAMALEVAPGLAPVPLTFDHMHDGGVIDPQTRTLPIQFDVANPDGRLLIGQTGTVLLYTGQRERILAVPDAAVLTEAGRPYVFVMAGGESFLRRYIEVGVRDGGLVGVTSGLLPGERVVTEGAYDVALAAASNALPAEGHVH
jgi:cobalt-zinc-cadmium efflux system membrane fusion protein